MDQPTPFRKPRPRVLAAGLLALLALCSGCDASSDAPPLADEIAENGAGAPEGGGRDAALDNRDAPPAEEEPKPGFSRDRLEQLVAPVALYPDKLLMDVLMAATYPIEVEEAGAWVKANPTLTGKALDDAIAEKGWDVSVNSLVHATQALELMMADPQWTRDLGDAFLAQQDDVLNAVQVMRTRACDLGNLKSNDKVKVEFEDAPPPAAPGPSAPQYQQGTAPAPLGNGGQQQQYAEPYGQQQQYAQPYGQQASPYYVVPPPTRIVRIVPVQPNFMYVPVYNPRVIYGPPPPVIYYPQVVAYPQATVGVAPIISFGLGLAIGNLIWGDVDWHHHHVYRRPYGSYYGNDPYWYRRQGDWGQYSWRHEEQHRRNVSYNRSEYGNVRDYRDYRYNRYESERRNLADPRAWPARQNQMRLEEDRLRRQDDKDWRDRGKQMRKEDDRRAKDDRRDWQQQGKGDDRQNQQMRKDDDRHRRDDDQRRQQMEKQLRSKEDSRAKEDDRAWKQQQKPQGRDDRPGAASGDRQDKGGRLDKGDHQDKDRKGDKGGGNPSKGDRGPGMNRPESPSKKDDRGPAMGRPSQPSPKGGGREQDRGGSKPSKSDRGPSTKSDHGSSSKSDRAPSMKPDRGGSPSQGGGDRGGYGGQPPRGGSDKGGRGGQASPGGNDRGGSGGKSGKSGGGNPGGDSGKGGGKDKGKDKGNDKSGGR